MERVLDEISFNAPDRGGSAVKIDQAYVKEHVGDIAADTDLSRYILYTIRVRQALPHSYFTGLLSTSGHGFR